MTKTMLAYETIKNTNFAGDYDSIEQQLMPILVNQVSDNDLVDAIKGLFEDLQCKRNMTVEKLELFVYDINDLNHILYNNQNEKLKMVEHEIATIIDNMK